MDVTELVGLYESGWSIRAIAVYSGKSHGWVHKQLRTLTTMRPEGTPKGSSRVLPVAPIADRFWSKVDTDGDCWEWQAAKNPKGYGFFGLGRRGDGHALAHRVAYELTTGSIPDGLCVLHKCDNPGCVRPDHLWLGTRADNNRDMIGKGRHWSQKSQ